jgi:hypothetical protein
LRRIGRRKKEIIMVASFKWSIEDWHELVESGMKVIGN